MSVKEETTSRSFIVLTAATFLMKIMSLVYVPVLLYVIKAEAHGTYTTAYDFFAFVYVVTNEGLTKGIARMVSERMARNDIGGAHKVFRISRNILAATGLFMAVLFFVLAGALANVAGAPLSIDAMRVLAPAIAVTSVSSAYRGYFQGRKVLTVTAVSQIWEQVSNVIISLVLAMALIPMGIRYGVAGAASGTLVGALVSAVYLIYHYRKTAKGEPGDRIKDGTERLVAKGLLAYTIPLALGTAATQFGSIVDLINVKSRLLVSGLTVAQSNITYSHLSSYKTIIAVPLTVLVALTTSLFPALTRAASIGDQAELKRKYLLALKLNYILTIPSAIGLFSVAKPANSALFDGHPTRGLLIAMGSYVIIFSGLTLIQTVLLQAQGLTRESLYPLMAGIIVKIIANYFLVARPDLRGQGAVMGSYLQGIVTVVFNEFLIRRKLGFSVNHAAFMARAALGALAMGAVLLVSQQVLPQLTGRLNNGLLILGLVFLGILIYSVVLILLGGISKSELNSIRPGLAVKLPDFLQRLLPD